MITKYIFPAAIIFLFGVNIASGYFAMLVRRDKTLKYF